MEVSSQGLMMDRVGGVRYDVGVFTNLSPDHIGPGEHASFEEYRSWKGQLFRRCGVGVVNIDDPNTDALLEGHTCRLVSYGMHHAADYRASGCELLRTHDFLRVTFRVREPDGRAMDVRVNMPGEFSVYNALAALAVGKVLGAPDAASHDGLARCVVKGRVELVPISKRFTILLDYAHNGVGMENILTTLREYNPSRLICMFGAGGNRPKVRRYEMGEICGRLADLSVLTADNSRFEDVNDIIADIKVGMEKTGGKYVVIPDRREAMAWCLENARPGDIVVFAGKGHEDYQEINGVKHPFDERVIIREILDGKR